jgi:hypothetical protein
MISHLKCTWGARCVLWMSQRRKHNPMIRYRCVVYRSL